MYKRTKVVLTYLLLALFFHNTAAVHAGGTFVLAKIKKSYPVAEFLFNPENSLVVSPWIRNAVNQFNINCISKASTIDDYEIGRWLRIDFSNDKSLTNFKEYFSHLPFVEKIDEITVRSLNEEWCSGGFTENSYLRMINCPGNLLCKINHPVKIAIVDDAFRISHEMYKDFIWANPKELIGNHFDDDGNGYIDDINGWDVSDADNNVSPPEGRLKEFYHGTYIAGVIATVLTKTYGKKAPLYFKIIPVKCISDYADKLIIKDGYKGIEYAIKAGADIINCSWAGDNISDYEKELLRIAKEKNILIVASAGNLYTERAEYPGAYESAIAVAAIDSMKKKLPFSNYGAYVNISAPGIDICSAGVMSDSQYITCQGTSASAAIVSAAAAILLSQKPQLTISAISEQLKNGATPLDSLNISYCGKLGAGLLNIEQSLNLINKPFTSSYNETKRVKGSCIYSAFNSSSTYEWLIEPHGNYKGIKFNLLKTEDKPKDSKISFLQLSNGQWKEYASYSFSNLPDPLQIPTLPVKVKFEKANSGKHFSWNLGFAAITTDSSRLYCSGTKYFELNEGVFSDGSENENYASNCDCKWQITVPPGKQVQINFKEFDCQPKVDFVYLYDGEYAIPDNIIAKFSGNAIPPVVTSRTNKVLIWFVTDGSITAQGWELHYKTK